MIASLRALLERPIADDERRRAFALAAAVVLIAAASLLLLRPAPAGDDDPPATPAAAEAPTAPESTAPQLAPSGSPAGEPQKRGGSELAARRFLGAYLDYLYGRGRAGSFPAASAELARRLRRQQPRVSPAARRRDPEIAELEAAAIERRRERVIATIDDGGVARYPIELVLDRRAGGWVVSQVEAD